MPEKDEIIEALVFAEKERLSNLRNAPLELADNLRGVLISQQIKQLSDEYDLVTPFKEKFLRPAGYDLTVGERYAIGGVPQTLGSDAFLTIPPYQVAVIQTFETINLPEFLIGRWNIRVKLAYEGLLWVGGAQVDPGFRGRLSCPIYNLSKKEVTLKFGEKLAMIDFVTAGSPGMLPSTPFQWWTKSVVFQQYNTSLESGVAEQVHKIERDLEGVQKATEEDTRKRIGDVTQVFTTAIRDVQSRIDTFLTLVFTVVSILFAGLGIVATKGSAEVSFVSSSVWIAAVALYFACKPFVVIQAEIRRNSQGNVEERRSESQYEAARAWYSRLVPNTLEIALAVLVVISSVGYHLWNAHVSSGEIKQANQAAVDTRTALTQQQQAMQKEIDKMRAESDAKINAIQQRLDAVSTTAAPKKN